MHTAGITAASRDTAPNDEGPSARTYALRAAVPVSGASHRSVLVFVSIVLGIFGTAWPFAEASVGSSIQLRLAQTACPRLAAAPSQPQSPARPPSPATPIDDWTLLTHWPNLPLLRPPSPDGGAASFRPRARRTLVPLHRNVTSRLGLDSSSGYFRVGSSSFLCLGVLHVQPLPSRAPPRTPDSDPPLRQLRSSSVNLRADARRSDILSRRSRNHSNRPVFENNDCTVAASHVAVSITCLFVLSLAPRRSLNV